MKAAVCCGYGAFEVVNVQECPIPAVKPTDVLIKVYATTVNSADWRLRKAEPFAVRFVFGLFKPRYPVLGVVFSGEIVGIGEHVKRFKIGDAVYGCTGMKMGAHAEFLSLKEDSIITHKPESISHRDAAASVFGAMTAIHFIHKANIKANQRVLIYGASGAVGCAAIQLVKSIGAEVTAVCSSANIELVKSLGADDVIDYTSREFQLKQEYYDVAWETVGKFPLKKLLMGVKAQGSAILSAAGFVDMFKVAWQSLVGNKKAISGVAVETMDCLNELTLQLETGRLKPVIDKAYPLEEIAKAHQYAEQGHKKGNLVIDIV